MKVAGHNYFSILCAQSNNKSITNLPSISPPVNSRLDVSSLLSYSVYDDHAVWVMRDGRAFAIGNGTNGKICGKMSQSLLQKQTELSITDAKGNKCIFLSAVCGTWYTLYLLQTQEGPDHLKLAYSCYNKDIIDPIFINTDSLNPVALFGGSLTAAAIDQDGIVILITELVLKSPNSKPPTVTLPDNERAVSVGCLEQTFFILSESGIVYKCTISPDNGKPELKEVEELSKMKIIKLSATAAHCLVVTSDGRVFGHGLNDNGRIGISSPFSKIFQFQQITELKNKKILGAYAGCNHSLFMTESGAVYACGSNYNGELFLESGPSEKDVLQPQQTIIKEDATFCAPGIFLSAIYVGVDPPPNTPNLRMDDEYPEFANRSLKVNLPSDFTSMNTSEVDKMVLRPLSAFDELKQLEDELISSSVSNFETKEIPSSPLPRTLNQDAINLNMISGSSTKKSTQKDDENGKNDSGAPSKRSVSGDKSRPSSKGETTKTQPKPTESALSNGGKEQNSGADTLSKRSLGSDKSVKSTGSTKQASAKNSKPTSENEGPLSGILNKGLNLLPKEGNSGSSSKRPPSTKSNNSTKADEKALSSQQLKATDKEASNSPKPEKQSENNRPSSKGSKNQKSIFQNLQDAVDNKFNNDGEENSNKGKDNQLSSASMDEKPAEQSVKGDLASNSIAHSISSDKISPQDKPSSKPASSAANREKSDNQSQKGMESSAKSKHSAKADDGNSDAAQNRSVSGEKSRPSSKGEQNVIKSMMDIGEKLKNNESSGKGSSKQDEKQNSAGSSKKMSSATPREVSGSQKAQESDKSKASTKTQPKPTESTLSNGGKDTLSKRSLGSDKSVKSNKSENNKQESEHKSTGSTKQASAKNSKPTSENEEPLSGILNKGLNLLPKEGNSGSSSKRPPSTKSNNSTKTDEKTLSSQHSQKPDEKVLSSASNPNKSSSRSNDSDNKTPKQTDLSKSKSPTSTSRREVSQPNTPKKNSSSDERPFYFESYQEGRDSAGSKLSINSELQHLRQQNNEMKELLASKDKEILRLTKLNETFIGSNKDLQSHLEECWDNQKHKIDKLDDMNSKRRKK